MHLKHNQLPEQPAAQAVTRHNILRSLYVARTPPVEARSPGRRSNVENAPHRRPVTGQQRAQTPPSIRTMSSYHGMEARDGNYGSHYVAIAT